MLLLSLFQPCPTQGRVSACAFGLELDGALGFLRRLLVPSCPQQRGGDVGTVRERVQLLGPAVERERLVEATDCVAEPAVVVARVRVAGTQLEGFAEFRLGPYPVELPQRFHVAGRRVRLAQRGVEPQRTIDGGCDTGAGDGGGDVAGIAPFQVGDRYAGVCQGKRRIERQRAAATAYTATTRKT